MEENKTEVKMDNGEQAQVPAAPEAPKTIAEAEVEAHREKSGSAREREIDRRCQLDPQKSREEVAKEFDAKVEEQKKIDAGAKESAAHAEGPAKPVSAQ